MIAVVLGAILVFFMFPKKDREEELLERYQRGGLGGAPRHGGVAYVASDSPSSPDADALRKRSARMWDMPVTIVATTVTR